MKKKFCFLCGKETEKLINGYCEDCYSKKFPLEKKKLVLKICKICGKMNYRNKWTKDIGNIRENVKMGKIDLTFENTQCPDCSRKFGGYYEAILQLRGEFPEDILDFIDKVVSKHSDRTGAYFRIEKIKEGINLYIGSKSIANKLAKILKDMKFEIKKSYKLVTKRDGKEIYRTVIVARY